MKDYDTGKECIGPLLFASMPSNIILPFIDVEINRVANLILSSCSFEHKTLFLKKKIEHKNQK